MDAPGQVDYTGLIMDNRDDNGSRGCDGVGAGSLTREEEKRVRKKRDDLEAIVDLLHDWCMEHGENYVSVCIINGTGIGNGAPGGPGYCDTDVFKDYKEDTTNEAQ